jgi:hypothetical protein
LELIDWINDQLTILAEAFGEKLTEERQDIYCGSLADLQQKPLDVAFRRARCELKWFPRIAELRELAGALPNAGNDGRPGPEEAWARMPKGERMEEDSIIWCEEERAAYAACRSLLLEGDHIGARMAFKERYERELAEARAQQRPARWTVSAGYDIEHRLVTLADGVQGKRITLQHALNFVPEPRRDDFAYILPSATTKGLLVGKVQKVPDLPGLPGLLTKMQMQDLVPDQLKPESQRPDTPTSKLGPDELNRRREELKAQAELMKRSRRGSADGSV